MAITSYQDLITAIKALDINGMAGGILGFPPKQINDANCPFAYLRLPRGEEAPLTMTGHGGWPKMQVDLITVITASMQDDSQENFDLGVTMMDSISNALRDNSTSFGRSKHDWEMRLTREVLGSTDYWIIVTQIRVNG